MARHLFRFASLLLASACATIPVQDVPETVPARGTADDAFACAMRSVNELRYEVIAADRGAGFLRARRETTGMLGGILTQSESFDILTVTIYPSATGMPMIRVVARGEDRDSEGRDATVASEQGYRDAATIRAECGAAPA